MAWTGRNSTRARAGQNHGPVVRREARQAHGAFRVRVEVVRPRREVHVVERHRYFLDGGGRLALGLLGFLALGFVRDAHQMTVVADRRERQNKQQDEDPVGARREKIAAAATMPSVRAVRVSRVWTGLRGHEAGAGATLRHGARDSSARPNSERPRVCD